MTMGTTSIGARARRAGLVFAAAICAVTIGVSAAHAQAPLGWSSAVQADSSGGAKGITAISCPSVSLCVAVDGNGNALYSTSPAAGTWSTPVLIDSGHSFTAISCPSTTLCFATDNHGSVYSSTAPASTAAWTPEAIGDGTTQLNGIACPSTTLCVVVDNVGDVLTSATPGTPGSPSWTKTPVDVSPVHPITAISCPTTSLCVAADNFGDALVPATPTSSSWPGIQLTGDVPVLALSCNSSAACLLAASDGTVYDTANISASSVTWSWTDIDNGNPLTAASCSDVGDCVVADGTGAVLESDNAASGQPLWTQTTIDSGHPLTGVSCLSAGLCVATDNRGYTMSATLAAPVVATGAGTVSSQTTATLAASVNPNDATLADCHFDYGPTSAYGSSVPCTVVPSATGGAQAVTASLVGLNASTSYHFRIVASSGVATADGADAGFTTPAPLKASPSISGTPALGSTLTCKANVTTTGAETISYQWTRDTVAIAAATSTTYVIVAADETHHLACQVTVAGDGGAATAISGYDGVPSQSGATVSESVVGTDKRGATSVSAPVTCSRQATGGCAITLALVGVKTAHHQSQKVAVGTATFKLAAGAKKTLSVSLNAAGRKLLKKQHTLAVTLTVSGTLIGTLKATLQTDKLTFTQKGKRIAAHRAR
jgi:hypothetical protein